MICTFYQFIYLWYTNYPRYLYIYVTTKLIINQLKEDLIAKYGTKDKDNIFEIEVWTDETKTEFNLSYIQYQQEFNTLLQEVIEIEYHEFKLDDFKNIETSDNYTIFYKLIQVD